MSSTSITAFLTSGRTLKQGRGMEYGKFSNEYFKEVSVCEMDANTLQALGIEEGTPILIQSAYGKVVVRSRIDRRAEQGIIFIPCGPYVNKVIGSETEASGMPDFKGIPVQIFPAPDKKVLSVPEILRETLGGK